MFKIITGSTIGVIVGIILLVLCCCFSCFGLYALSSGSKNQTLVTTNTISQSNITEETPTNSRKEVTVIDLSTMSTDEISAWCKVNNLTCNSTKIYSDTVAKDNFINQSTKTGDKTYEGSTISITYSLGKEPSKEFKNALEKAKSYSKTMNMSKQGIYDQLTSEYGEQFPADAAQYAIDNLVADWNANALAKAKTYQDTMNMSKSAIYDQLISEYGEKFTSDEAQYAIDHLDN